MLPLNEKTIRASFINASRRESTEMVLPTDFDGIDWDALEFFGWRDRKIARRAYAVVPVDGEPVGLLLRQAEAAPRSRAQCSWCQDVKLPNDVVFFSARRSGPAGRNGNTVGSLVCSEFECSANVHTTPPPAYLGYDVEAAREERIAALQRRAAGFVATVISGT